MKRIIYILALLVPLTGLVACEEFLTVEPEGAELDDEVANLDDPALHFLNTMYTNVRGDGGDLMGGRLSSLSEAMGDNIDASPQALNNADYLAFYLKNTSVFTGYSQNTYRRAYQVVNQANQVMKFASEDADLDPATRDSYIAQALFWRAYIHFSMLRFYAQPSGYTQDDSHLGIPLRLEVSGEVKDRNTVAECYASILEDLDSAESVLPAQNGIFVGSEAATALKAVVEFQRNNFAEAYAIANSLIEGGSAVFNPDPEEYDLRYSLQGSGEAYFTMQAVDGVRNEADMFTTDWRSDTYDGGYVPDGRTPTFRIDPSMYTFATQNPDDLRGQNWYYLDNEGTDEELVTLVKFNKLQHRIVIDAANDVFEDPYGDAFYSVPHFTISELKLIRAESAAELNTNLDVAVADVNDIRNRAGITPINTAASADLIIETVRDERRKEFIGEGHRFHDLRRIGALVQGGFTINGSPWDCPGMAIQFPDTEVSGSGGPEFFTPNEEGGCN